jgi:hypothetical protein
MRTLIPFKLDPVFKKLETNPMASCSDCGKDVEFRKARFVWVDISEKGKARAPGERSLDEMARNMVWTILCPECWQQQYHVEVTPERIQ